MNTFLHDLVQWMQERDLNQNPASLLVVVPTKRAQGQFRRQWTTATPQAGWMPQILTLQQLRDKISGVRTASRDELFVELYALYKKQYPEGDTPEGFYATAHTLIGDWEEVRQHHIDPGAFFKKVNMIRHLQQWMPEPQTESPVLSNYLNFWDNLADLNQAFYQRLEERGLYTSTTAMERMLLRLEELSDEELERALGRSIETIAIAGFTALTPPEQELMEALNSRFEFHFVMDQVPAVPTEMAFEAHHFVRTNESSVPGFASIRGKESPRPPWESIQTLQAADQAKVLGSHLAKLSPEELNSTAVILLNPDDLSLLLNALPENVQEINIGIGRSLNQTLPGRFITTWVKAVSQAEDHRDWIADWLAEPFTRLWIGPKTQRELNQQLKNSDLPLDQWMELSRDKLLGCCPRSHQVQSFLNQLDHLLQVLLSAERLKHHHAILKEIVQSFANTKETLEALSHASSSAITAEKFFLRELRQRNVTFKGDPSKGLQIMNLLETRALDFRFLYFLSFNETVFPAVDHPTFIPLELRNQHKLPSTTDREAALAYHFFRLLTRAEKVVLLHTSDVQAMGGGEVSRYLLQMKNEWIPRDDYLQLKERVHLAEVQASASPELSVTKTESVLSDLKYYLSEKGLSPSALITYLKNPHDFYLAYVLGLREEDRSGADVDHAVLGQLVHGLLEKLYQELIDQEIEWVELTRLWSEQGQEWVEAEMEQYFSIEMLQSGRIQLVKPVVKEWIARFLEADFDRWKRHPFRVIGLELSLESTLSEAETGLPIPLKVKGVIDRVDQGKNGENILIDYKTGMVKSRDLDTDPANWSDQIEKESKAIQLLFYAWLHSRVHQNLFSGKTKASIYSFRNAKDAFLYLYYIGDQNIGVGANEKLEHFLVEVVGEMLNPEIPFERKEEAYQKFFE